MTFRVAEIEVPDSLDLPEAADFLGLVDVRNAVEASTLGTSALQRGAESTAAILRPTAARTRRHLVATLGDEVVGRAIVAWPTAAGSTQVMIEVEVLPAHRGAGIGTEMLRRAEEIAVAAGRTSLQSQDLHTVSDVGPHISSPTGAGGVWADDPGARFLVRHGYALALVARISQLDLAGRHDRVSDQLDLAQRYAGPDYRVVSWAVTTPLQWLADIAGLKTAISTDEPTGDLVTTLDVWDAERVKGRDVRMAGGGRTLLTAAAEHVPSGRLVAYTELDVPSGPTPYGIQADTLVERSHRGHRLGLLVKAANILLALALDPPAAGVTTFNAEDNVPMLAVNDALGFSAIGQEGSWQKQVGRNI